jgi:polyhydroxybutyrate depolymerase
VNGVERTALLLVPSGWTKDKTWPLVIVSHGHGGTGNVPAQQWGFADACDRRGWVGVFPNTGREITGDREDPLFPVLVERLVGERSVDPARVYAAGFSGGNGRVYTFAARDSAMVAAIAGGGGKIGFREMDPELWDPRATGAKRVSVLHLHGKRDTTVPIEGGTDIDKATGKTYTLVPMREGIEIWAEVNGATLQANASPPPGVPDRCSFHRYASPTGHLVEAIVDPNLAHSWPDWGTEVVLDFFDRVPKKS